MLRTRKVLSALAAAAVLSTSAFAGVGATIYNVPVASAQEGTGELPAGVVADIPARAELAIHKRVGSETGANADGTIQDVVPGEPASGITFSVFPVLDPATGEAINLTTNAGWEAAAALVGELGEGDVPSPTQFFQPGQPMNYDTLVRDADGNPVGLGNEREVATNGAGTALFDDLSASVYLVVEHTGQTFTGEPYDGQALAPSVPFLATVPMTHPDGIGWLETVNVYPKNQVVEASEKAVFDPVETATDYDATGSALGELVGYTISSPVPTLGADTPLDAFNITDKLPVELGAPIPDSIVVTAGGETLILGDDYTVQTWQVPGATAEEEHEILHISLTPTAARGLAAGENVVVTFHAPVDDLVTGTLNNQAWTNLSTPGWVGSGDPEGDGNTPGTPSNETRSIYGEINITKTGAANAPLGGATFELYRCTDGAVVNPDLPIQVNGLTQWTTATAETATTEVPEGSVSISGIHLANVQTTTESSTYQDLWADNGTQFCLVEVASPAGYSILPQPLPVVLEYSASDPALVSVDTTVSNIENNAGFTLPLTGGNGFWLIVGAGVILLVVAGGYYVIARNRSESTN